MELDYPAKLQRLLIVFVSQHAVAAYANEAFSVGTHGYVVRRALFRELREAVQEVLAGLFY